MNQSCGQAGFTLLELMVAMALSVVIATISAMALSSGADFYSRNVQRQSKANELKILERTLRPEWQLRFNAFTLTNHSIEFVTTQPRESDLPGNIMLVNYECSINEQLSYSLLHTSIELSLPSKVENLDPRNKPEERRRFQTVLVNNLKSCSFAALKGQESKADKTQFEWVSQWRLEDPAPKLIRFQVTDFRGDLPNYVFVADTI